MKDSPHSWERKDLVRRSHPSVGMSGDVFHLPALWEWQCSRCGLSSVSEDDGFGRPLAGPWASCDEALLSGIHDG